MAPRAIGLRGLKRAAPGTKELAMLEDKDLCPLARKVPKVKPCSDVAVHSRNMANRNALQWCIHQMVATPDLAIEVRGFLERRAAGKKVDEDANWCSSYNQVVRLPAYWMASWIQSASNNTITIELLEAFEEKEANVVRHLFYYFTGSTDNSYLPRPLLNKAVCWSAFMKRHERLGSPAHKFRAAAIREDNTIDWLRHGPYKLVFDPESGKLLSITHRLKRQVEIPSYIIIDKSFKITNPFSDKEATAKLGMASYAFERLFDEFADGPRAVVLDAKSSALAACAADAVTDIRLREEAAAQTQPSIETEQLFGESREMEKKQAALAKAREVARQKRQARSVEVKIT